MSSLEVVGSTEVLADLLSSLHELKATLLDNGNSTSSSIASSSSSKHQTGRTDHPRPFPFLVRTLTYTLQERRQRQGKQHKKTSSSSAALPASKINSAKLDIADEETDEKSPPRMLTRFQRFALDVYNNNSTVDKACSSNLQLGTMATTTATTTKTTSDPPLSKKRKLSNSPVNYSKDKNSNKRTRPAKKNGKKSLKHVLNESQETLTNLESELQNVGLQHDSLHLQLKSVQDNLQKGTNLLEAESKSKQQQQSDLNPSPTYSQGLKAQHQEPKKPHSNSKNSKGKKSTTGKADKVQSSGRPLVKVEATTSQEGTLEKVASKSTEVVLKAEDPSSSASAFGVADVEKKIKAQPKKDNLKDRSPIFDRLRRRLCTVSQQPPAADNKKKKKTKVKKEPPVFVPKRQYYHSESYQKMQGNDFDEDSDIDLDESWQYHVESSLLNEFTDVSAKEKTFMKLWNIFMPTDIAVGTDAIPKYCMLFIQKHAMEIRELELDQQLIWHLTNLWDEAMLAPFHIVQCMHEYKLKVMTKNAPKTDRLNAMSTNSSGDGVEAGVEQEQQQHKE